MARTSFSERYKAQRNGTKLNSREEEKSSSSARISTTGANKRGSFSDRYRTQKLERSIGFDTFESDLTSASDLVNSVYGGWKDAETMNQSRDTVTSMYDRLNKYKEYVNSTVSDQDLTKFNADMDTLIGAYGKALGDWDALSKEYSNFINADAHSKAKKDYELSQKYAGLDYAGVQDAIAKNPSDASFLSQYGLNVGYSSLADYDSELKAMAEKIAKLPLAERRNHEMDYDKLEAARNKFANENRFEKYSGLMRNPDFAENSGYVGKDKNFLENMFTFNTYDLLNAGIDEDDSFFDLSATQKNYKGNAAISGKGDVFYMTDDEKSVYNYLYNTQGEKAAEDFYNDMKLTLSKRKSDAQSEDVKEVTNSAGWFSNAVGSALSVPWGLVGGVMSFTDNALRAATGQELNSYSGIHSLSNISSSIRDTTRENLEDTFKGAELFGTNIPGFLYDTVLSIGESALGVGAFGKGASVLMGMGAASSTAKELKDSGASDEQILKGAAVAGAAEMLFEKLSIDGLLKTKNADTFGKVIKNTLKQAGVEASEEIFTEVTNQIADYAIRGGASDFASMVDSYMTMGYTEEDAKKKANLEVAKQIGFAGIGGAISGGLMGGVATGAEYSGYKGIGNQIMKNNQTGTLSDIATELNGDGFTEYIKLLNEGTAKKAQIGSLYQKVSEEADKRYLDEKGNAEMHAIANRANELGDTKNSGMIASAVVKKLSGKSLSADEKTALKTDTAKTIMTEIRNAEIAVETNGALNAAIDRKDKVSSILTTVKATDSMSVKKRMASMHTGDETIDNASGNKITIEGMRTDDEGNTVLQTSEGERLLDDVTLSDGDAEVIAIAEGMDADKADLFVSLYQSGSDVQSYSDSFDLAFSYGKNAYGTNYLLKNKGVLTESQAASVYELGLRSNTAEQQKAIDEITAKHFTDNKEILPGDFDDSAVNYKKLNGRQKAAVSFARMLSEKTGVNVVFFESQADESGHRTAENGRYERDSNTIYVDAYAGMNENVVEDAIIPTLSHEMTHWMKNKAPEAYAKLSGIVMDTLGADMGASPAVLVGAKRARFNVAYNADVSGEYAQDELIARACEDMLTGSARAKEILSQMDEKTARTLAEKVKEFFEKFKEWMADLLGAYKSNSNEAKIIRKYADRMNELQEVWNDAFEKAIRANQAMEKVSARPERMAASERQYAEREYYRSEVAEWFSDGMPSGETFILGNTSDVIQGLGAMEMDIYILGDKIKTILDDHPEITIDEIKKIPQILERPILILASKNVKGKHSNSRIVAFGNVKGKNGQPVLSVLDLKPFEKGIRIDDMQKVSSAYTKTGENRVDFIKQSLVMYADKKRATSLLRTIGFSAPMELNDSGFLGSISYINEKVKLEGKRFSDVFREREIQYSDRDSNGNGLTPEQVEFFKDSKVRDENGNLKVMYHGTAEDFTIFKPLLKGGKNGAAEGFGIYFADTKMVSDAYGGKVMTGYLNITRPATSYDKTIKKKELVKLIKVTCEAEANQFVDDGEYDDVRDALPDTWVSNYVYTYDISMNQAYEKVADNIISSNGSDMDIVQEVMKGTGVRDYESAYKFYDILKSTIGVDGFITEWENENVNVYSKIAIAFDSNQFKNIDNLNPTNDSDIRYSERGSIDLASEISSYNLEGKWNDYVGVQKRVIGQLRKEKFFDDNEVVNEGSGMVVRITARGIKETLGNGNRFQTLPRELKELKVATIRSLPDVIRRGRLTNDDVDNIHGEKDLFAYISSGVLIDGNSYGVKVSIKKKVGSNIFWIHNVDCSENNEKSLELLNLHTRKHGINETQDSDIIVLQKGDSVNIQFSERQTESIYDAVGELKRLQRENDKLRKDVDRLRQRNRLEHTVTGGTILNDNHIEAVAGHILNIANSRYSKESLAKELKEIYSYLQSDGVEWDVFMSKSTDAAQRIIADAREHKVTNDYSKMILDTLRTTRVSLNDTQKEEAKSAYGSDWHRMYFGRVLVANDGIPLESVWSEWSMMYPDVFDADISDADMAIAVLDAYDTLKASSEIVESYDNAETARAIALEIYNQFWNVSPIRTLADKHNKEVKRLKFEHRQEMKELRERYDMKKTEAVQSTKDRYQKTIQRLKEKRAEDVAYYREKSKEYTKEYKEKLERKAVIDKITKKALKLNTWLVKNSKDEHVPEILKKPVAAVLKSLNFSSERLLGMRGGDMSGEPTQKDISLSKAFENLQSVLSDVSNSQITDKEIEGMYGHLDMPDGFMDSVNSTVKEIHDILRNVGDNEHILNQMTVEQLEEMSKILSTLTHAVRNMNKALATANGESIASLAQDTMMYADGMGQHSKTLSKVTDFFNYDNVLPAFAFKRFGDGGKKIFEGLQDGWDKFAFHVKEIIDYTESLYDAKEVREWSEEVHEFDLVVRKGVEKVKMTTAQIMSLYCLQKREQARGHLIAGGIRVGDFKTKKLKTVSQPDGAILKPADIDRIISVLTDRQVAVADGLQEFMNTVCTDWGNEISMKRFGYKAFGEENYFPIQSDKNNLPQDDAKEKNNNLFRLLNMSFTKGTIKNANNRVVIDSIFDVFASHSSDMAKYNALALPVLDAFKWYNYKEKARFNPMDKDDKRFTTIGVKQSLEKAYGEGVKGYIVQFLRDINGESNAITTTEQMSKKLISNYKVASVGANLRVAILQPTAYVRASVLIDPKYLAKAFTKKPQIQKAKDTCGMALWKSLGFYDININAGVTEMIKHDDSWYDVAKEKSMFLAEKADELTWGFLYNACEAEVSDKNPRLSGDAKDEAVAKRLREVIYSTQVVDSTMTRTQAMRSRSTWSQIITSFMSEPMVSYNLLHDQLINFMTDKKKYGFKGAMRRNGKYIARTAVTYAVTTLCAATMGGLIDTLRDDEEDKEFGEIFFANIKDNALSDVLSMLPLMRDVVSVYKGFGANRLDMQGVTSAVNATKKLAKDIADGDGISYKTGYSVMRAVSQMSGLPGSNAMRDVVAIWNSTIGEMYDSLKIK